LTTGVSAPDWRRNQVAVSVAVFIGFTSFTLVMPFLPLYFAQLGVKDTSAIAIWSGISLGVTPAITAAVAPFWARIADRYGRKVLVARALGSFVVVMAALAAVRHPWQVLALRCVLGFFAGYGTLAMTMAADSAPPEHMATAIGWVQTAQRLGPALGPVIGGVLAAALGLRETFLVAAACYFGAVLLVMFGYHEVAVTHDRGDEATTSSPTFTELRLVPHFVLFVGLVFGLQLVDRSIGPVLPLYLSEIGTAASRVPFLSGLLFTMTAGAAALGNQVTRRILERWAAPTVIAVSAAVATIGAAGFALGPAVSVLMVLALPFGFGIGVATTSVYTIAGHAVTSRQRNVAFGYLSTAYLVGLAVSPIVAGLIGSWSMRTVFIVDSIGLAVLAWVVRQRMRAERP
jgi:MFS transporter, DHA1 family, multidrug resistance protein